LSGSAPNMGDRIYIPSGSLPSPVDRISALKPRLIAITALGLNVWRSQIAVPAKREAVEKRRALEFRSACGGKRKNLPRSTTGAETKRVFHLDLRPYAVWSNSGLRPPGGADRRRADAGRFWGTQILRLDYMRPEFLLIRCQAGRQRPFLSCCRGSGAGYSYSPYTRSPFA
jgi:hypothetical protein